MARRWGVNPSNDRRNLWLQQTRVLALSYDYVCVVLRLAVLIQYRLVTYGDGHRATAYILC